MKESLIGKWYESFDNSYAVNITSSARYPYRNEQQYLAGINGDVDGVLCKIVSEPFNVKVRIGDDNRFVDYKMIMVEHKNNTSCVLFNENSVHNLNTHLNGLPVIWEE